MTTTTSAFTVTQAEILEAAADLLETHGIHRGDFQGPKREDGTCSHCILGAINKVAFTILPERPDVFTPDITRVFDVVFDTKEAAKESLYEVLEADFGGADGLADFNDNIGTDEQILALLRKGAALAKAAGK